ncbi:MAG: CHAT domain-containing protein [Nostoc sp. TH1S01]|nr:CHAT domain-containing protein [Nostoc sp. TH1S01]
MNQRFQWGTQTLAPFRSPFGLCIRQKINLLPSALCLLPFLLNSGLTKAEALRQAQLNLLSNPQYDHPYYWAGLILVGSWL